MAINTEIWSDEIRVVEVTPVVGFGARPRKAIIASLDTSRLTIEDAASFVKALLSYQVDIGNGLVATHSHEWDMVVEEYEGDL